MVGGLLRGAAAGAAGTTALNTVSYLDMLLRARAASTTPEDTVERLSEKAGMRVPGDGEERQNRVAALGSLTGIAAGVGVGALLGLVYHSTGRRPTPVAGGLVATAGALIATNGPMTVLGVTDPRTWPARDWIADLVPHLAYGAVTTAVLAELGRAQRPARRRRPTRWRRGR
jgi:hypothetical protein